MGSPLLLWHVLLLACPAQPRAQRPRGKVPGDGGGGAPWHDTPVRAEAEPGGRPAWPAHRGRTTTRPPRRDGARAVGPPAGVVGSPAGDLRLAACGGRTGRLVAATAGALEDVHCLRLTTTGPHGDDGPAGLELL